MVTHNEFTIRECIQKNLQDNGIPHADIHIQWDPLGGWRIAVISKSFAGMSEVMRRDMVVSCVDAPLFWLIVSTPSELREDDLQKNPLGLREETEPLWPEALARGMRTNTFSPCYPSDLEEDLDPPVTVTFYSLRGGVGRSTALAYTAWLLSQQQKRVICVDMDLEAPGLGALFGVTKKVDSQCGVASLLLQYDMGEDPDISKCLIPIDDEGYLFLMPAGRPTPMYADILSQLDPQAWYREEANPLRMFFDGLRRKLPFTPDVLLLDSRTGISTLSAPLLFEQADLAVVVFFPHDQAREGTGALVQGLKAARSWRRISLNGEEHELTPEPRFLTSFLPGGEVGGKYKERALEWVCQWLGFEEGEPEVEEVVHFVPYSEILAVEDMIQGAEGSAHYFDQVADWVQRFVPTDFEETMSESSAPMKEEVLGSLSFDTETAERQEDKTFLNAFLQTGVIRRALKPETPLVLGRKGTGKTSVYRALLLPELQDKSGHLADAAVINPASQVGYFSWHLNSEGFKTIDEELIKGGILDWKQFWLIYIAANLVFQGKTKTLLPFDTPNLTNFTQFKFIEWLLGIVHETKQVGLVFGDWLSRVDQSLQTKVLLLFDGLDTGFGNSAIDRERRKDALIGLFSVLTEWDGRLHNLKFKMMLREDIWRKLHFENKSHLYGRAVVLKWNDQLQYLKVILKQALVSKHFREAVNMTIQELCPVQSIPLERWPDAEVVNAWNVLAGERMAGGKTAFTRNWVWARLGDANGDHAPRHLNLLFAFALEWEKEQQQRNPYERSLIRPKALIESLPHVSKGALDSLLEEFRELKSIVDRMQELGGTPFAADRLSDFSYEEIELAREVGLIKIHEGTEGDVSRYAVPELYRWGLNMGRKGPA